MDKERELDNLNVMLEKGLISQTTYQEQRCALLGIAVKGEKTMNTDARLRSLSLWDALKFSFRPATFGAAFIFLFVPVMFCLIGLLIFFGFFETLLNAMIFSSPSVYIASGFVFEIILSVLSVFWEAVWITFFVLLSLEYLSRDISSLFTWKALWQKGLCIGFFLMLFSVSLMGVSKGFSYGALQVQLLEQNAQQQFTVGLLWIVAFVGVVLGLIYALTTSLVACIGPAKNWLKTFCSSFKRPLLILFALGGGILNGVVVYMLSKFFRYVSEPFVKIVGESLDLLMSSVGLGIFGLYLVVSVILFFVYASLSPRGKTWFKLSFLFVIPSLIILVGALSILPSVPPLTTSFYFAYFLMMQVVWGMLYVLSLFIVQGIAFFANILTQVWCHVTHKKNGNNMLQDSVKQTLDNDNNAESVYQPPEVFR